MHLHLFYSVVIANSKLDYWLFVGAWGHVPCLEYTDGSNQVPAFNATHGSWACANKVVCDSLELMDFAIGLVNSFPDLLDGQVKLFFEEFELQKYCKTNRWFQFLTNSFGSKAFSSWSGNMKLLQLHVLLQWINKTTSNLFTTSVINYK